MLRATTVLIIVMLTSTFAGTTLSAQPAARTVVGVVSDATGAPLGDVLVEAIEGERVRSRTTTDTRGYYQVEVRARSLRLRFGKAGFESAVVDSDTHDAARHDVTLKLGAFADTTVVTASRVAESRALVSESLTVLSSDEITARGAQSLADIVRTVPGLNVESTGREGSLASLFSRGGESDYNLVLIDGVRVNISGGRFDFNRVAASEIERVEIVRGAQSSVYGSDAIGAVVQIFTKRAGPMDGPRLAGSLEGGSFGTWHSDLRLLGGAKGRADYSIGGSYRGTDGAFEERLTERDRYDQLALDLNGGFLISDTASVRGMFRHSKSRGRSVGPLNYGARDTGTRYDSRDLSANVTVNHQVSSAIGHSLNAALFDYQNFFADNVADPTYFVYAVLTGRIGAIFPDNPRLVRLIDKGEFDAIANGSVPLQSGSFAASTAAGIRDFASPATETRFRRPAVKYQANFSWAERQMLTAGYEYERESNRLNSVLTRDNHAYFVQQKFDVGGRWLATLGGRLDDNSRYGSEFNPKASVGAFLVPFRPGALSSVKVTANFGKGIKNAVFDELFGGASFDGNPDLKPERARTLDAGVEITLAGQAWLGRATYFDNRYRDQIAFRSTGPGRDSNPDYLNIDGSKASGVELEFGRQRPLRGLTASVTYGLVDTEVISAVSTSAQFQTGQPLLRRPRHSGGVWLSYSSNRVRLGSQIRIVGERHDSSFLSLTTLPMAGFPSGRTTDIFVNPGYTVVAFSGEYRVRPDTSLTARLDNATNEQWESALGYPGLPRSFAVGLRFDLGLR